MARLLWSVVEHRMNQVVTLPLPVRAHVPVSDLIPVGNI